MNRIKQYLALLLLGTFCILEAKPHAIATLEYFYASDGMITGRSINGNIQNYEYDKKGQLLAVVDAKTGQKVEQYVYDPAGNILKKTVNGKTTTYTYDKANQLVSSVCDGKETKYAYDAAGRMVKEGSKSYCYGYLDKVMSVQENGQNIASFTYHADGQIESATAGGKRETFLWDNLALISRDATQYVNEPYATGGNPILANDNILFNDMLGSTLSINGNPVAMTAFGETDNKSAMFTGKPYIGELGYVFLFRNYRAEEGKWQTMDPIGYPDGWNNLAYCNNHLIKNFDLDGLCERRMLSNGKYEYDPCDDFEILEENKVGRAEIKLPNRDISCGFSGNIVLLDYLPTITVSYSYNCGQTCSSHTGHQVVMFTCVINYTYTEVKYLCIYTRKGEIDQKWKKTTVTPQIIETIPCAE